MVKFKNPVNSWRSSNVIESLVVTGAFRPDGFVFTQLCKIFQAKVFKEKKLEDKRIHDNLILLRVVTFSIIVLKSLRRIARWVVFAVIVTTIVVTELIEYQ